VRTEHVFRNEAELTESIQEFMTRFQPGDIVRLNNTIRTVHADKTGQVIKVVPNRRGKQTLDKYIIRLPDGVEIQVWDIQLAKQPPS